MRNSCYLAFLLCAAISSGCARNPVTGNKEFSIISERQEIAIGDSNYRTMQQAQGGPFTADKALCEYVTKVGHKVANASGRSHLPYEFVILNDPIPNAWCLPGGKIAINKGLLVELESEAELAAVLGHEIVHAAARHGAQGMQRGILLQGGVITLGVLLNNNRYNDILIGGAAAGAMLINQKYARCQELEADRFGILYMTKAGYNPDAAIRLQETFLRLSKDKQPNWVEGLFASHPPSQERIDANKKTVDSLQATTGFEGKAEYQKAIHTLKAHESAYKSYEKGKKALASKSYKQAKKFADEAVTSFPAEGLFWNLKGKTLLAEKQPQEALKAFSEAISRNPLYFDFYLQRAEAKSALKDKAGAQKDLRKSLLLLPTGEGHEFLGRLLFEDGKKKQAIQHFTIASKAQSPAGKRAQKALNSITSGKQ